MKRYLFPLLFCTVLSYGQDTLLMTAGRIFAFRDLDYDVGKASINLEESDLQELTRLAIAMKKMPEMKIEIWGHTDVLGDKRMNRVLSKQRAENIRNYLMGVGIAKSRIEVIGYGGDLPLYKKSNPANRRIEVKIVENPNPVPLVTKSSQQPATKVEPPTASTTSPPKKQLRKIALIIGNSDYAGLSKLKNPVNDVDLIASTLNNLQFTVSSYKNLSHARMTEVLRSFTSQIAEADVVFFYFAGHGLQHQGSNYLLPIDVTLKNGPMDLQFETIKVDVIFNLLEYTNKESLNIIVLDACRNNPFANWTRSTGSGLAEIKPPSGSLIAFATSPGAFAFDGTGVNGVYTEALAEELRKPQRLEDVFMNTRLKVEQKTNGVQSPWELFRLRAAYQLAD